MTAVVPVAAPRVLGEASPNWGRDLVQPDHPVPGLQLAVHAPAFCVVFESSGDETEHPYQPGVHGCNVVTDENRDRYPSLHGVIEHGHLLHRSPNRCTVLGARSVSAALNLAASRRRSAAPPSNW